MPKTIVYNKIILDQVTLHRAEDGWHLGIMYTMIDETGVLTQRAFEDAASDDDKLKIRKFLKPFMDILKSNTGIDNIENFIDPPEV